MNNDDLIRQIEELRKQMISVGVSTGFTSSETIILSKKIDKLLNLLMGIT
jgi:ribosomal protein S2